VIHGLSNGDILKINEITNLSAEQVFTFLSYTKDFNSMK